MIGLNDDFVNRLGGTLYLLFSAVALLLAIGSGTFPFCCLLAERRGRTRWLCAPPSERAERESSGNY